MCSGSWSCWSSSKKHPPSLVVVNLKRELFQKTTTPHVSVAIRRKRLRLRRLRAGAEAMEIVNLKLYLENRCIIAENERLRARATALRRENLALLQNLSKTSAAVPEAGAGAGAAWDCFLCCLLKHEVASLRSLVGACASCVDTGQDSGLLA